MNTEVGVLLSLLDDAFDGEDSPSLLSNLRTVPLAAWTWVPPGGRRSIQDIVRHVGGCKIMYRDYAFGIGKMAWEDPLVDGVGRLSTVEDAIGWLRDGQTRLRESIAALEDEELPCPRLTNWGEMKETRWIVTVMIEHDLYHAGEINYIRSLHSGRDRWAYEQG